MPLGVRKSFAFPSSFSKHSRGYAAGYSLTSGVQRLTLTLRLHFRRDSHDKRVSRDVLRNDASRTRHRAVADLDRCDEHRVRSDANVVTDLRLVLVRAVVIAGDGARTNV